MNKWILIGALLFGSGLFTGWFFSSNENAQEVSAIRLENAAAQPLAGLDYALRTGAYDRVIALLLEQIKAGQSAGRLDAHHRYVFAYAERLIGQADIAAAVALMTAYLAEFDGTYEQLSLLALALNKITDLEREVQVLFDLRLLAADSKQDLAVTARLDAAVLTHITALHAQRKFDDLASFLEELIVKDPGNAFYYYKLGELRLSLGEIEEALASLYHIEYDAHFGADVQRLIEGVSARQPLRRAVPLVQMGAQLFVDARLDSRRDVRLLVDSGASITIVNPAVLEELGYDLGMAPLRRFSTANGIVEAPVVAVASLAVGETVFDGLTVGALPIGADLDGLLGMNFLQAHDFTISQSEKILYLSD